MSSERRIKSSRANGAKSHGPSTPEGKLRSAASNLRHGILARTVVLDEENFESFTDLLEASDRLFNPEDEVEKACVENMAVSRWRLMRLWGVEKAGLAHEIRQKAPAAPDTPTRTAMAFRSLSDESRWNDVVGRLRDPLRPSIPPRFEHVHKVARTQTVDPRRTNSVICHRSQSQNRTPECPWQYRKTGMTQ